MNTGGTPNALAHLGPMALGRPNRGPFKGLIRNNNELLNLLVFGPIFGFGVHMRDMGVLRGAAYSYMPN